MTPAMIVTGEPALIKISNGTDQWMRSDRGNDRACLVRVATEDGEVAPGEPQGGGRSHRVLSVGHSADIAVIDNADGFCGFGRHGDGRFRARKDSAEPDFRSAESVRSAAHG